MSLKSFLYSVMYHTPWLFPDKLYIQLQYRFLVGHKLDLRHPRTFTEKLQWLKLYDRKPIYTKMVDKYDAKDFIKEKVGSEYVIPTIGIYNSFDEIDFNTLPNRFVIKTTHDSGTVIICKDKSMLNIDYVRRKMNKSLKNRYYYSYREWPYKDVKPRIIIEELIGVNSYDLKDYKWYCFNGVPKMMLIVSNRGKAGGHKGDFYDMDKNHLAVYQRDFENNPVRPELPDCFDKMKELASSLSKDVPHLRVDFYYIDNHIYVGELTFSDSSGCEPFIPSEYEQLMGDYIKLPENI